MTGKSRVALSGLVALVLAVCMTACSGVTTGAVSRPAAPISPPGSGGSAYSPTGEDWAAIEALLSERSAAVLAKDRKAFLATIDPRQGKLRTHQGVLFDNLAQLRPAAMSYTLDRKVLPPARVPGKAVTTRPLITELVKLPGTFSNPISNAVQMTFVRRSSGWFLGAENQRKRQTSYTSAQERPWFGAAIAAQRSGEMTVVIDKGATTSLDALVASLRRDIDAAADILGEKPTYDVFVDATSNGLAANFRFSKEEAAAVSFPLGGISASGKRVLVGSAVKVNPKQVDAVLDQPGLMRHELTHFLLERFNASMPKWLTEGVADYVAYYPSDLSRYVVKDDLYDRAQGAAKELPATLDFGDDTALSYLLSWAAVTWLVRRSGMRSLKELMADYLKERAAPRDVDKLATKLLRKTYGVTEKDAVAGMFAQAALLHHE